MSRGRKPEHVHGERGIRNVLAPQFAHAPSIIFDSLPDVR
jgi:hypothetical protein